MKCELVIILCMISSGFGQFAYNDGQQKCPVHWYQFQGSCYRFVKSPIRPRPDAQKNCQAYSADLVYLHNQEEYDFIVQQLSWLDPQHHRWYTAGKQQSPNVWMNDIDGTPITELVSQNLHHNLDDGMPNKDYLIFSYTNKWGLEKESGERQLAYICKTTMDKISYLLADERSFFFGAETEDPEKVPRGPYFTKQPTNVVYDMQTLRGSVDVTLTCAAKGLPYPTFEWFKVDYENDALIAKRIDPMKDVRLTISGGTLIINSPDQKKDRGKYFCKASNKFGTIVSETVTLSFGFIGEFNLKRPNEYGYQNWGKAIACDPPEYYPAVKFYWSRNRFPNLVEEDRRVFVSYDGALYFSALEAIDNGNYSCSVHGEGNLASLGKNGPLFQLTVTSFASPQQLQFANDFPKIFPSAPIAGHDVRLECIAFGYPVPLYNWTRKGNSIPKKAEFRNHDRVLVIPRVNIEDEGEYVCRIKNDYSIKESSVILSIQVEPNFTIPLVDRHMDIGSDLTWTCEAFGVPEVSYGWYKNGEPLDPRMDTERYLIRDNILTIKYLDPEKDAAMYQCQASNTLKTSYSSAQLRVLSLKPSFRRRPLESETYAGEGGKITILCKPEAAPKPEYVWRKDGNVIGSGGAKYIVDGNLTINPVSWSDEGMYTCYAKNTYGSDQSSGLLTVLKQPTFIEQLPPSVDTIVTQNVDLRCAAAADERLDIAYVWYHNGIKLENVQNMYSIVHVNGGLLTIYNMSFANSGEYECQVISVVGSISSRSKVTVIGPPSPPGGVHVHEVVRKTVTLRWTDGSDNGRTVRSYVIYARTNWNDKWFLITETVDSRKYDFYTDRKEVTLEDSVYPWSAYEFRLNAINELGSSLASEPSPIYNIPPDRPYVYPTNVSGGGGKIGDLTITWTPLARRDHHGPNLHYKIFWKKTNVDYTFQSKVLSNSTRPGIAIVPVSSDFYYTQYDVKVQAINDIGSGPESPVETIYSAEDIPHVQPQRLIAKPFNSTAIEINWSPISMSRESIRGKLIGYRIKYWKKDMDEDTTSVYYLSRSLNTRALIVGLQPDTYYYARVMAFNSAGAGPESEWILERTFRKAASNPPSSVFIKGVNPSTIKVYWRYVTPNSDEEPISGYKIRVWPMGEDISVATDTFVELGETLEAYVYNLSPGKRYSVRVLAYSNGGDGRMSSPTVNIQMGREDSFVSSAPMLNVRSMVLVNTIFLVMFQFQTLV